MHPFIPLTENDKNDMLGKIGIKEINELFQDIPQEILLKDNLNLEKPKSELEAEKNLRKLAEKNISSSQYPCFLGAGAYDRYIPAVVKHLAGRSEFYTAYTPYQPEISQGTLQVIFEYQTMICNLTGMDVANASMYDGATACTEAAILAAGATRRNKILVSSTLHPDTRKVLQTYLKYKNIEIVEINENNGMTDFAELEEKIDKDTAGVILQYPNFFGILEEPQKVTELIHKNKSLLILAVDPVSLALLKSPGELGADIAVGEGQSLGNPMNFGGPHLGFIAATTKLMRKLPGRIVGQSVDGEGKRAFVLTLQAREQHIRRYKATSNICSNQALNALTAAIYLTTMGKEGLREAAFQSVQKAHYAQQKIIAGGKYKPTFPGQKFFSEFAITSEISPETINENLLKNKIIGGYKIGSFYPRYENSLLYSVTEKRTKEEIDQLAEVLEVIE